jgi:hypothetical protein
MKFDAKAAKAMQACEHMLIEGCPGLRLESRASAMTWTYRYKTDAGLMKQTSLGRWPAVSSHEAVSAWLSTRDTRRQTGVDPHAERLTQRAAAKAPEMFGSPQALIAGFLADYIDKERKAESAGAARSMLERLLEEEPDFAKCPIDSISRSMAYSQRDIDC